MQPGEHLTFKPFKQLAMLPIFLFVFLAFSALTLGTPLSHRKLPPCSATSGPCKCPPGVTFKNLTSYSVIGAPAAEVEKIMNHYFESEWLGGPNPYETTGKETAVGATRSYNFTLPDGYFIFTEVQTVYSKYADGSFVFGFGQAPEPRVIKLPGGAEFHGEWAVVRAQQTVLPNETAISWNNWRCDVGTPYDAAAGHEGGMANVSSILQSLGKHTGTDIKPFTVVYTIRDD
ncbi:MAG: hypothetical protein Q9187_004992 [Circinaria calcarea]